MGLRFLWRAKENIIALDFELLDFPECISQAKCYCSDPCPPIILSLSPRVAVKIRWIK